MKNSKYKIASSRSRSTSSTNNYFVFVPFRSFVGWPYAAFVTLCLGFCSWSYGLCCIRWHHSGSTNTVRLLNWYKELYLFQMIDWFFFQIFQWEWKNCFMGCYCWFPYNDELGCGIRLIIEQTNKKYCLC